MARHKTKKGICRLCLLEKTLSFEHVPPKVAFNKHTKYLSVPFEEYAKIKNPLKDKIKGKQKQGGVGFNSLCKECNSFLGSSYVNAYKKWVYGGVEVIKGYNYQYNRYNLREQEPLAVLKQIISMFLSINNEQFTKSYPELAKFVLDPDSNELPDQYRILTYLNNEGGMRYVHQTIASIPNVGIINCNEIAFPPYGYVMVIDFEKKLTLLNEITYFKNYKRSDIVTLDMEMYKLPTYTTWPLDYRTKQQYQETIEQGIKKSNDNSN